MCHSKISSKYLLRFSWRLSATSILFAHSMPAYLVAKGNSQQSPPADAVFKIAFLVPAPRTDTAARATRLQWAEPSKVLGPSGNSTLGPFLKAADLRSIQLTLNANAMPLPSADDSPKRLTALYSVLRATRLIEILAVAPSAQGQKWRYITGKSQRPQLLELPHQAAPDGQPNPWSIVAHIFSARGFNAFALPDAMGRVTIVTPLRGLPQGTQGAVYALPLVANPSQQKVDALVELTETSNNGSTNSTVVAAAAAGWQPKPWTPTYILVPDHKAAQPSPTTGP